MRAIRGIWGVAGLCVLAACPFHPPDGGGGDGASPDAGPGRPDAPPGSLQWRLETVADFDAGTFAGAIAIDRGVGVGVVEPIAYTYRGLQMRGANSALITDVGATSWDDLEAETPSGTGIATVWGNRILPGGVGLDDENTWTMWGDGELFLPAGSWDFTLNADDHGFLELAVPGGAFQRVVTSELSTETGTFIAPGAGWYPVRMALCEDTGQAFFDLKVAATGATVTARIPDHVLRAPANKLAGLWTYGSNEGYLLDQAGTDLDTKSAFDRDWAFDRPTDLGMDADTDLWAERWAGQVRIVVDGTYVFRLDGRGADRIYIDGEQVQDLWPTGSAQAELSDPIALTAGWHDFVLDFDDHSGDALMNLTIDSGPDLVGMPFPADRLRPVVTGRERITAISRTGPPVALAGATDFSIGNDGELGATVTAIEVGYRLNHPDWSDVRVDLRPPGGGSVRLLTEGNSLPDGDHFVELTEITVPSGATPDGTWTLRVDDRIDGDEGTVEAFHVTPHYAGGAAAIEPTAVWLSDVHDFGSAVPITYVMWGALAPEGSQVAIEIRTCAAPCADGVDEWIPLAASGEMPAGPPARYAQLRATLTGDGNTSAWLDWIDVLSAPE